MMELLAAAALAGDAPAGQSPLRVCLLAHNMPLSTSHEPWGIEGELAFALGEELGRPVVPVWIEDGEMPDSALLEGRCDAAMGAVVDAGDLARHSSVAGIALSDPYYSAGYVIVQRPEERSPNQLTDIQNERIAVEMISVPIYTLKQRGHSVYALDSMESVIEAVADERADYGYVWGLAAAWLLRGRSDVVVAQRFSPEERWDFAVAISEGDGEMLRSINAAISDLVAQGVVEELFEEYATPYLPAARR